MFPHRKPIGDLKTARKKRGLLIMHKVPPALEGGYGSPSGECSERSISLVFSWGFWEVRAKERLSCARNA